MEKLTINEDACIGCGACVAIDSKHFDFNDEGKSTVISQESIDTDEVKNAIGSCPVNAIKIDKCQCEHCDCHEE